MPGTQPRHQYLGIWEGETTHTRGPQGEVRRRGCITTVTNTWLVLDEEILLRVFGMEKSRKKLSLQDNNTRALVLRLSLDLDLVGRSSPTLQPQRRMHGAKKGEQRVSETTALCSDQLLFCVDMRHMHIQEDFKF